MLKHWNRTDFKAKLDLVIVIYDVMHSYDVGLFDDYYRSSYCKRSHITVDNTVFSFGKHKSAQQNEYKEYYYKINVIKEE
jgi:hypothetical protein